MIGTIVKKPRITVLTELPMLAMAVNAPIHLEKEVISLNNKEHMSMKVPLCSSWCISPILLTDIIFAPGIIPSFIIQSGNIGGRGSSI